MDRRRKNHNLLGLEMINPPQNLKKLYFILSQTRLPTFPKNEAICDWITNLIEIDAIIAGQLHSVACGSKINKKDIPNVSDLERSLGLISIENEEDKKVFNECKYYLELLKTIRTELINHK